MTVVSGHMPVMLGEVIDLLSPENGACYVDGTFGAGGYSQAILEAADCKVHAFDQDPVAVAAGAALTRTFRPRLEIHLERFSNLESVLRQQGVTAVDGVALDIGVSSMQLDDGRRGFSFRKDGPLDMRMSGSGRTAADIVNGYDEKTLARLIRIFGEERRANRIARAIVSARSTRIIRTTRQLASIIENAVRVDSKSKIHPATRSFLALRIYLNNELEELARGLAAAERLLKPAGRLVVVAFHSLEDRIVKKFFSERSGTAAGVSRHRLSEKIQSGAAPSFRRLFRRARKPGQGEIRANPRARSARLRAGERTSGNPWPLNLERVGVPGGT